MLSCNWGLLASIECCGEFRNYVWTSSSYSSFAHFTQAFKVCECTAVSSLRRVQSWWIKKKCKRPKPAADHGSINSILMAVATRRMLKRFPVFNRGYHNAQSAWGFIRLPLLATVIDVIVGLLLVLLEGAVPLWIVLVQNEARCTCPAAQTGDDVSTCILKVWHHVCPSRQRATQHRLGPLWPKWEALGVCWFACQIMWADFFNPLAVRWRWHTVALQWAMRFVICWSPTQPTDGLTLRKPYTGYPPTRYPNMIWEAKQDPWWRSHVKPPNLVIQDTDPTLWRHKNHGRSGFKSAGSSKLCLNVSEFVSGISGNLWEIHEKLHQSKKMSDVLSTWSPWSRKKFDWTEGCTQGRRIRTLQVVWLYPDGRGASVVVPEAAAEELGGVRADYTYNLCVLEDEKALIIHLATIYRLDLFLWAWSWLLSGFVFHCDKLIVHEAIDSKLIKFPHCRFLPLQTVSSLFNVYIGWYILLVHALRF